MAYIEPRKNKQGEIIAYRIRVNKGYDKNGKKLKPYELNFKPDPDKTERQNMKALNETAVEFEKKCKQGYVADRVCGICYRIKRAYRNKAPYH